MRIFLLAVFSAVTVGASPALAETDGYPNRPVRIVVPYATGGGSDILARQIGAGLQQAWGQGVTVENKAGASGNIGSQDVVRAKPDGYTLLLQNSTMVTNLGVMGKLPYDPENDLAPIMLLGVTPIALVANPTTQIGSVKDLLTASKVKPDALSYGSCGIGTPQHFVMELLKQKTGVTAAHAGYKGCSPAMSDVVSGQIPLAIVSANLVAPYVKDQRLMMVGVSSAKRYALLPDALTFDEQGVRPLDISIWYALMGPAKLPPALASKIAADVSKILGNPTVQASLSKAGVELQPGSAQELAKLIHEDAARYLQLARSAGIKAE